jgi:hypothetical protein
MKKKCAVIFALCILLSFSLCFAAKQTKDNYSPDEIRCIEQLQNALSCSKEIAEKDCKILKEIEYFPLTNIRFMRLEQNGSAQFELLSQGYYAWATFKPDGLISVVYAGGFLELYNAYNPQQIKILKASEILLPHNASRQFKEIADKELKQRRQDPSFALDPEWMVIKKSEKTNFISPFTFIGKFTIQNEKFTSIGRCLISFDENLNVTNVMFR